MLKEKFDCLSPAAIGLSRRGFMQGHGRQQLRPGSVARGVAERDAGIPLDGVRRMHTALSAGAAVAKKSEIVIYPEAPHAFFADYPPSQRKEAAEDGRKRRIAWLRTYGVT